jgi:heptosyltransferase I
MSDPKRILIIRLSSLGDIIHTFPAFSSLRAAFPDAQIDWLVEKRMAFLLYSIKGIDNIYQVNTLWIKQNPLSIQAWTPVRDLTVALRKQHYDLSLDFQGLLKTGLLSFFSGAKNRLGFSKRLAREYPVHWFYNRNLDATADRMHVVDLNLQLAQMAGGVAAQTRLDLSAHPEDVELVNALIEREGLDRFVVINPGGGWPTKRWEPRRYGLLAARIQKELHLPVVVTTGPEEEPFFVEIAQNCGAPPPRHFQLSFLQLIPLLKRARLFVGGDTGPFHLACALGTPVVGIFGPTSPGRNGPWNSADEAVANTLPCSFCGGRTCATQIECMDIPVDDVFQSVVRRLQRNPS